MQVLHIVCSIMFDNDLIKRTEIFLKINTYLFLALVYLHCKC